MDENQIRRFYPVRGSVGNVRRGNYWEGYSPKLGRRVQLFSSLERAHWVLVESTPEISIFCEQPMVLVVRSAGGDVRSIPDMWVRHRDGHEELREVKTSEELVKGGGRAQRQIQTQQRWCQGEGMSHRVITSEDMQRDRIRIANWQFALGYLSPNVIDSPELSERLLHHLRIEGTKRFRALQADFEDFSVGQIRREVFELLRAGALHSDLDIKPFTLETVVWAAKV